MKEQLRKIRYFLFGQHFSDGVRITLAILIPAMVLSQFGLFDIGLTISLGALSVSIVDSPGPVTHKRNAMLVCCLMAALVAIITGFARMNTWVLGAEILLLSFMLSMLGVYGTRATAIGTAALLIMILVMDRPLSFIAVWRFGALVLAGGLWYMLISLSFFQVLPYRASQQALGECIHEIAKLLSIKADFYSVQTSLDEDYKKLFAQQVVVSEKQDAVRELLFKSRQIVQESTPTGRRLVLTFVDVMDLYEQIVAFYYDYADLRERFGATGILDDISRIIHRIAIEMDYVGLAVQANRPRQSRLDLGRDLERLKGKVDTIEATAKDSHTLVLKKILVSLRNVDQRLSSILRYTTRSIDTQPDDYDLEYDRFITHQTVSVTTIRNNLTLTSSIFRHSVRMSLACLVGFIIAKLSDYGTHSYWILLTITVILKPGFSLSKQRNYERLMGTLAGGAIGVAVLLTISNQTVLFLIMLVLMIGTFSFQRTNYIVMVVLMTPYILILFTLLGMGGLRIVEERVLDTLIGSAIAFAASYFLFPRWESQQLKEFLRDVLKANLNYLRILADGLSGRTITETEYKLARKDVYVSSANLSAAFQRMTSEPRSKQWHQNEVNEFVVLNHILSANVATIASTLLTEQTLIGHSEELLRLVRRAIVALEESLRKLGSSVEASLSDSSAIELEHKDYLSKPTNDPLLKSQLEFIQRVSYDIGRLTDTILV
ncbi:Inner membrane protein yccS [Fibrisoma limi BUZ 3]|uniref:Inner membrane protein yccS n=1 Tax=Fibrisoma limi BUZ 3 TaxID=1185876 RepID=I2GS14_9BACT|nr:FUSC family membrane protein [Fibrisoma limi]CCH56692.1 Inner membrane protein yccS [Fibrisoma limi BUZ 3]